MVKFNNLHIALIRLIEDFNWDYVSGRMRGSKWAWIGIGIGTEIEGLHYPDKLELIERAHKLAKEFAKEGNQNTYIACGGIALMANRKAKTVTLQFGKKEHKPWLSATENYN